MKKVTVFLMAAVLPVLFVICGCSDSGFKKKSTGSQKTYAQKDNGQRSPAQSIEKLSEVKIYIDSVPSGAEVYLLQEETEKESTEKDKLLGKTPLILEPSQCPAMRFWIKMDIGEYLKKVETIPEMKDWIAEVKWDRLSGRPGVMMTQKYFNFEVSTSRNVTNLQGGLMATGPIYKLDWPNKNRICVLFIPRKKKISLFYSLMPPSGTFKRLEGRWPSIFRDEYRFSKEQADEATECLTRCGKYITMVKHSFKENVLMEYNILVHGPANDIIAVTTSEIKLIPGYND